MIYSYFTVPDLSLTQDSSVDPMGMEPIWVYYGQRVFGNRITSVASDVRGFTINAFHHYVLNRFLLEEDALVRQAKERYKGWADQQSVKAGLLILLEDLLTYIFYQDNTNTKEIEKQGILGMLKANAQFRDGVGDFKLKASRKAGLLKNQISLGFTGRYRNPMILMGFFDKRLGYLSGSTTAAAAALFKGWDKAKYLADAIHAFLRTDLLGGQSKRTETPEIWLEDLVKRSRRWQPLRDGYLAMFGSNRLPVSVRHFWVHLLGFDQGAAAALYQSVDTADPASTDYYETVFRKAMELLEPGSEEAEKLNDILRIQPLLSHTEFLVRYLAHPQSPEIDEVREELAEMKQALESAASQLPPHARLDIRNLAKAVTAGNSIDEWLLNMYSCHQKVMQKRGGAPWFELTSQMKIRRFFSPAAISGGPDIAVYLRDRPWLHTFYINTLRNIKTGLS